MSQETLSPPPPAADAPAAGDAAEVAAALARNDRYLREFIESLAICPYARTCRESGRLHREVLLHSEPQEAALVARILELSRGSCDDFEVGLLILPRLRMSAWDFDRFIRGVQRSYQKQRTEDGGTVFVVAFHPDFDMRLDNPDVAVRFMRRSPDPTIQLVRPEAIARLCGDRDRDVLSRNIAEAGLRAVLTADPQRLAALLADHHRMGR